MNLPPFSPLPQCVNLRYLFPGNIHVKVFLLICWPILGAFTAFEDKKKTTSARWWMGGRAWNERVMSFCCCCLFVCVFYLFSLWKEELPRSSVTAESSWYRARIQVRVFPIFHFPLPRARSPLPVARLSNIPTRNYYLGVSQNERRTSSKESHTVSSTYFKVLRVDYKALTSPSTNILFHFYYFATQNKLQVE